MPELLEKRSSATPSDTFAADGYDYFWSPPDWVIKDPKEHIIEGYASLPNLDDQGDVIPLDAIDAALPRFMKWGNLREMHDKKAAGKVLAAKVDERGLKIMAKVEDPTAWAKVRAGVYQGFSVGGDIPEDATEQRADGARIIKELLLNEISLVDRPANPKARISVVKLEKHFTGKTHTHQPKCNAHGKENCEECGCDRLVGHPPGADHSSGMADNPLPESRTGVGTCKALEKDGDEQACKIAEREDTSPKEGKNKYGNVRFADAKNKKYPIDTEEHVRAALSYWGMPKNKAKYSPEDQKRIGSAIHAAARRMGIGSDKKTEKGITMTTLEKVKSTLVDPDQIKALEAAEEIIAKAAGQEWHTQREVGEPNAEAETGVDLEDNDAGAEDPVEDVLDKAQAAPGHDAEADGEAAGESGGKHEDESVSKAGGGCMDHMNACHKSLTACHKALDDGHPAKKHAAAALGHIQAAKKCFPGASKVAKALGSDNTEERLATLEEELEMVATKLSNTTQYFAKMFKGLPRSRPAPPEDERGWEGARSRDEENGNTLKNARLSMNGNP
jgi:HK97 family phage prohead protease